MGYQVGDKVVYGPHGAGVVVETIYRDDDWGEYLSIRIAQRFATWVEADPAFELLAEVPFSVVCFRFAPPGVEADRIDELNAELLDLVNASGEVFLSHTRLDGRYSLRLAVGHIRTTESHVARAWELLRFGSHAVLRNADSS